MERFLPKPTIISAPFWDGCREGELRLQQCTACRRHIFYPAYICPHCGASSLEWKKTSGNGTVYSCTVVERQAGANDEPIVVGLIQLDEGPIMMSNVRADDPYAVAIGARVSVRYERASDEITLPVFVPDAK
jgi:uncharacterized OB-fold protein